jgi:hypothetical protein
MTSPYRAVLGPAFDELHPRLRAYFDAIPVGATGHGRGVFDTVGTPRRWLWPVLALFGRAHVIFPVWQREVPFTVRNLPVASAERAPVVRATRRFELRGRTREMFDEIGVDGGLIVDRLGSPALVEAWFTARVVDGSLRLVSRRVAVRIGRLRLVVPRQLAPVVALTERYDDVREMQAVSIVVRVPLIGRVYQYAGAFRYEITRGSE